MSTILVVSGATSLPESVSSRLTGYGYKLMSVADMGELVTIDMPEPPRITLVNADGKTDAQTLHDMIRAVLGVFDQTRICVILDHASINLDPQDFFKAGAHGVYTLPFEYELLMNAVFENAPTEVTAKQLDMLAMTRISVTELAQIKKMPIDIFVCLPANKKIITYRKRDSLFDPEMITKFSNNPNFSLYIRRSDLATYRKTIAENIKNILDVTDLEERANKLRSEVAALLNGFFSVKGLSETESQAALSNLKAVMSDYISATSPNKEMYKRIMSLASHSFSNYNHSVNTSTYSGLFGLILGYDNIEPICLAGLLHDVGLSLLPPEIAAKDENDMSAEELEIYKKHPTMALELVKSKGFAITPELEAGILQHHECMDGSGYMGLKEVDIHPVAKIISLADAFDELTSLKPGHVRLSPAHALMRLAGYEGARSPRYSSEFHGNLITGLIAQNEDLKDKDVDKSLLEKAI